MRSWREAGWPPLAPLRGAVPGWDGAPLTAAQTRGEAAAVLRAERETSVLDPRGVRWLWWREVVFVLALVALAVWVWAVVQAYRRDTPQLWMMIYVPPVMFLLILGRDYATVTSTRAVPSRAAGARGRAARRREREELRQLPAAVPPVASWPAGSEAYAVLCGAAKVESVAPAWLCERVGLPADVGAQWIAALRRDGLLRGGGHVLGLSRLPELHVELTMKGRERLDAENERLRALASP
jgi:hypothetical protein